MNRLIAELVAAEPAERLRVQFLRTQGTHTVDMILSAKVCRLASHSGKNQPM